MKKIRVVLQACFSVILISTLGFAQDDETRQATGLPMKIGGDSPAQGNLSGKIKIEGLDASQKKPTIFVSAIVNGVTIDRKRATDSGNYFIPGIPRENVMVIVEVNGEEVGREQLMPSYLGNMRQDFFINLSQLRTPKPKTGVISANTYYQRSPENEKLFEKATNAAKDKNSDEAIKLFKKLIDNDSKDFVAKTDLGTLYFRNEKYPDAEKYYTGALELKPDYMMALLNLGKLYLTIKQAEKAIPGLTKATETEPTSADAQYLLGEAYLQIKKGSKSLGYFYEALRLAPIEKADAHLRLGWLYNAAGLKDKAVEEYKQFLQKVTNHPDKENIEKYIKENSSL